jgi:hypothetical protein
MAAVVAMVAIALFVVPVATPVVVVIVAPVAAPA